MSPLLLLGVFLPFISATVTLEDHEGKSRKLEVALKFLLSERGEGSPRAGVALRNRIKQ